MAETLSPPIGKLSGLPVTFESPRPCDGGFLVEASLAGINQENLVDYKDRAHMLVTPSDEETGVPLILHPQGASREIFTRKDDDHHPEHPSQHRQLLDLAGLAVRGSRVQNTNWWLHHMDAHETFRGPVLPVTTEEKFRRVVYNTAGYIPEMAICFRGPGDYYLNPLSEDQRLQLWRNKVIRVEHPKQVRDYLKNYLFEQKIDAIVGKKIIKGFMSTKDPIERWKKAKIILDLTAQEVTTDIGETYKSLSDRTLLPPSNSWRVSRFIVALLANHESEKSRLSLELQESLRPEHA